MDPTLVSVTDVVRRVLPEDRAGALSGPDQELRDLGLGSLELVGLLVAIEDAFSVRLPADVMHQATFHSVRTLTAALRTATEAEDPHARPR
ncbi:phosphopantetheine-binding protein [Streptomyces sp. VNUA74]|uniref:phosphopantetheine-binding protein n=1 Tax=Streptomyces TaxID=1883 RepID=UPI00280BA37E|nr:phosphopantetheine-binding protein [Streptomyces sp. VNUA74]WML78847.1 phosphopantetheine-binding protein [Streptomyces sp. VNUA74]